MKKVSRKQRGITQEPNYKIDEHYKTHGNESDDLFHMQAHYHKKIRETGKRNVYVQLL